MPAAKSPSSEGSGKPRASSESKSQGATPNGAKAPTRNKSRRNAPRKPTVRAGKPPAAPRASFGEDLANRIFKPLDVVLLTRERIQATLDEAAERGRVTRTDANDLVAELFKRGRQQTDELLDRARRTVAAGVGVGSDLPIADYDELTVAQVEAQLPGLAPAQLRRVRDYERSHANRKSVLAAAEKLLG